MLNNFQLHFYSNSKTKISLNPMPREVILKSKKRMNVANFSISLFVIAYAIYDVFLYSMIMKQGNFKEY